jgi:hypothetical protein
MLRNRTGLTTSVGCICGLLRQDLQHLGVDLVRENIPGMFSFTVFLSHGEQLVCALRTEASKLVKIFLTIIPRFLCGFFIKLPPGCNSGKKRQKADKEKDGERGIWDLCMLLSGVHRPPSHLPPFLHVLPQLPAAMVIRTGGTAGRPPLSCHPHPISAARDLNGGSLGQPLILRTLV